MNGIQDARIAQCRGVAFALQFELRIVDAPGNISGENDLEVDAGGAQLACKEKKTRIERAREGLIGFLPFDIRQDKASAPYPGRASRCPRMAVRLS